jgi:putrescine transport system substrate-binding protein
MTDPSPAPPPGAKPSAAAQPSATQATAAQRRRSAFGTAMLAGALSAVLLGLWAAYLVLAPDPAALAPAVPPPSAPAAPTDPSRLTLVAPRQVIEHDLLRDFETASGLAVDLVAYDNEESLLAVAADRAFKADVVAAAGPSVAALRAAERLAVLPARAIPQLGAIDPGLRRLAERYDPDGLYAVPFATTVLGLGVNRDMIATRLDPASDTDSWALLFDPLTVAKLADCGVVSVDAPSLAFPAALRFLDLPADSESPADTERASAVWESIRPSLARVETRAVVDALAGGQACLALAVAGDVYRARAALRAAGRTDDLRFIVPREGSLLRLYMLAVPRAARDPARAAALIDYLLKPEVGARMTNARWVANAVPASHLYIRADIKADPAIYPDLGRLARLAPEAVPAPAAASLRARFWQLVNAGTSAP